MTDARYRFERGVDPASVLPGLDLATQMILEICGGKPSKAKVAGAVPDARHAIAFDLGWSRSWPARRCRTARSAPSWRRSACDVDGKGDVITVTTPTWRPDMHGAADLVEEVVRIAGLDKVPSAPLPRRPASRAPVLTERQKRARRARRVLAARGLVEAITWSFIPPTRRARSAAAPALELANPISIEMSSMRPSLLPGLLAALKRNRNRGFADVALFEVGQAYRGDEPEDQYIAAAGVRAGTAALGGSGRHWDGAAQDVDLFDAKADVVAVLAALGFDAAKAQITRDAPAWFHPGRSGTLRLGPKIVLAHFGEVHPATLKALDVPGPVAAFEVFLDALPAAEGKSRAKPRLEAADLLPVRRDFAFVLDRDVAAGDVVRAAAGADKTLIRERHRCSTCSRAEPGRRGQEVARHRGDAAADGRDADRRGDRGGGAEGRRRREEGDRRRDPLLNRRA